MEIKVLFILFSFFSLTLLLLVSFFIKPPFIAIEKITEKNIDEKITTQAIVDKIYQRSSFTEIKVKNFNISLIIFEDKNINLSQNSTIKIEGTVSSYKNRLEIVVDKIK